MQCKEALPYFWISISGKFAVVQTLVLLKAVIWGPIHTKGKCLRGLFCFLRQVLLRGMEACHCRQTQVAVEPGRLTVLLEVREDPKQKVFTEDHYQEKFPHFCNAKALFSCGRSDFVFWFSFSILFSILILYRKTF